MGPVLNPVLRGLAVLGVLLLPNIAHACPHCALRGEGGFGGTVLLWTMILFPFSVVGTVVYLFRRMASSETLHE